MIETEYEEVEDMKEEEKEEDKEDSDDINPPLFDPEVAVELQVSDLDVESVLTPDAPATSTTPSCGRKTYRRKKSYQSSLNMDVVAQIIAMHCSVTLT